MSGSGNSGDIFDVKRIRRLVELMNEHELSEIDLRQQDQRIRLRKGHDPQIVMGPAAAAPVAAAAAGSASGGAPATAPKADEAHIVSIKSPMIGTFYTAPSPDAQPFVKVGARVQRLHLSLGRRRRTRQSQHRRRFLSDSRGRRDH